FVPIYFIDGLVVTALLIEMRLGTGSLWMGIGWHVGWDWSLGSIFASGGNVPVLLRNALLTNSSGQAEASRLIPSLVLIACLLLITLCFRVLGRNVRWRDKLPTNYPGNPAPELPRNL